MKGINMAVNTVWTYEPAGRLVMLKSYSTDGSLEEYWLYEYNATGRQTKDKHFDGNDNLIERNIYDNGHLIRTELYGEDGKLIE